MTITRDLDEFTATNMIIALNELFPDTSYGAIPVIDQYDALEAYLALDDRAELRFEQFPVPTRGIGTLNTHDRRKK